MWSVALLLAAAPPSYELARARLEEARIAYAVELERAKDKDEVLDRASATLFQAISEELLPAWTGTPWAFHGTSATPGSGEIACGMFVGTILEHAGFRVDRIALGRLASERIALTLTGEHNLRRWRLVPVELVEREVSLWGEGLYMVGLDYHAAFIVVDSSARVSLVHSSYYWPGSVRSEPVTGNNPFRDSKYRVIAKLLDRRMVRKWILGRTFKT